MIEFFNTLSSYVDKITTFFSTLFENVKQSITEIKTWISYLPASIIAAAAIVIVLIVIYKVLGRS